MTQRIMELARTLGGVRDDEEELLATLCGAAQRELTQSLRDGVRPEDCSEPFVLAGAWIVLAGLEVSREAGQAESFSAGDVSVHSGNAGEKVRLLREQAKRLMKGWSRNDSFLFYGVS